MDKEKELDEQMLILKTQAARLNGILGFGQDEQSLLMTMEILSSDELIQIRERHRLLRTSAQRAGIALDSEQFGRLHNLSIDMGFKEGRCSLEEVWAAFRATHRE